MKINKHHKLLSLSHAENIAEKEYDSSLEHPTLEQSMLRLAMKSLTRKQREVWEMHAYDKLTQDQIAAKIGIVQSSVARQIATIQKKLIKWCKEHQNVYELLKEEQEESNEGC